MYEESLENEAYAHSSSVSRSRAANSGGLLRSTMAAVTGGPPVALDAPSLTNTSVEESGAKFTRAPTTSAILTAVEGPSDRNSLNHSSVSVAIASQRSSGENARLRGTEYAPGISMLTRLPMTTVLTMARSSLRATNRGERG